MDFSSIKPDSLFYDTTNLRETDPVAHARQIQSLDNKARTLDIVERQLKISNRLSKLQRLSLEGENLELENQIVSQDRYTIAAQLEQSKAKTQIELAKLEGLNADVRGYRGLAGLNSQRWDMTLRQMELQNALQAQELQALEAQAGMFAPQQKQPQPIRLINPFGA